VERSGESHTVVLGAFWVPRARKDIIQILASFDDNIARLMRIRETELVVEVYELLIP
jgi:hypothetical protein